MTYRILIVFLVVVILVAYQQVRSQNNSSSYNGLDLVDNAGNIRKPADVRDSYQALGTYSVVDLNGDTELHYTYAAPGTAEYYRKNGKFAEGTVLVKEVDTTDHGKMTTGDVHWASGTKVWFVMIKDEKEAIPAIRCGAMDGDGHSSSPTRPISRSQLISKKTALAATSRLRRQTGFTSMATRSSNRSKEHDVRKLILENN